MNKYLFTQEQAYPEFRIISTSILRRLNPTIIVVDRCEFC